MTRVAAFLHTSLADPAARTFVDLRVLEFLGLGLGLRVWEYF